MKSGHGYRLQWDFLDYPRNYGTDSEDYTLGSIAIHLPVVNIRWNSASNLIVKEINDRTEVRDIIN